jgi:acetate kinase
MRVLVVNTGSTSLKLQVLATDDRLVDHHHVEDWEGRDVAPIDALIRRHAPIEAIGHRVVHGGTEFRAPTTIDDDVLRQLEDLVPLAPLHQPRGLAGISAALAAAPEIPQVACFDTAFHRTLPAAAASYALPPDWRHRWPLQRFGFHGLSHAYAVRRAGELTGPNASPELRVVTCHLGAGASLCASLGGRSLDTTMGFTPLEGLVMATRAGSVDPGLVLWLITEAGLSPDDVRHGLEHRSGLTGLAGAADMRRVLEQRSAGDDAASFAFEVYIHALARHAGAMTAAIGGIDVLVFTGGVGEGAPEVRSAVADHLGYLGVEVDTQTNASATGPGDHDISASTATVSVLVIEAREDLEIGSQTRMAMAGSQ